MRLFAILRPDPHGKSQKKRGQLRPFYIARRLRRLAAFLTAFRGGALLFATHVIKTP